MVSISFDAETSAVLGSYTEENVGKQMAILFNGEILSMPVIQEPFSEGCAVSGDFTEEEARGVVAGLRNPPPAKYRLRE